MLDGLSITNGKTPVAQSPALDKSAANRKENNNSKLRNITKLLFCNPAQTVTLFLASQAAFASAATIKPNNSSGLAVRDSNLPFNDSFLNASEIKHDTLVKHKTQMKDNVLKAIEESQISMRLEYKDATENFILPFDNKFLNISGIKDNAVLRNNTSLNSVVTESSTQFFGDSDTFKIEENAITSTGKSAQIVFTEAFKDKIERVKSGIDKLIIALTKENNIQRFKRSAVTDSSTITKSASSGVFTRPNLSSKAAKLENEMRKMKEDIAQLKQSFTISSGDKERLASLETTIETLKRLLDDQSRETEQKLQT